MLAKMISLPFPYPSSLACLGWFIDIVNLVTDIWNSLTHGTVAIVYTLRGKGDYNPIDD